MITEQELSLQNRTGRQNGKSARGDETAKYQITTTVGSSVTTVTKGRRLFKDL